MRSIYPQRPGHNDGNVYVGTTRNMILEGSLQRRFNQVREEVERGCYWFGLRFVARLMETGKVMIFYI